MSSFTHLHVHSHYSLLDGLTKIKPLVKTAKERGFKAIALTDSGVMYGAIEFYKACLDNEIKPIIGFEAFLGPRSRLDKELQYDKPLYHLTLLAENYEGYRNLIELCSAGQIEGLFQGKPRIDFEILKKYSKHVIVLSGCIDGQIAQLLKHGKTDEAKQIATAYRDALGPDYFYLELQDHPGISGQLDVNNALIALGRELGIPLVVTRDVHYLRPEDAEAQDVLTCIRDGQKMEMPNRESYRLVDRSLNTATDIATRFRHVPEAIENTGKIADRIDLKIDLDVWHFAPVTLPPGKTADDVLHDGVYDHVAEFYSPVTEEVKTRIEYELGIIKTKGYSPYFLCVSDYVNYAKDHGIVETTRGSAAGSLVSYVLGITTVDPIRFKLPFERFLNPFRPSPPDIDTDFADNRRDEMIKYVTDKYGKDKVAQIITFGTMAARASVRDVGRALGLSYSFCDQVSKLIPIGAQGFPMTIERALKEEPDLKKLYDVNADVKRLLDLARKVEGCARHTSIHAAGVVIAPSPLTDFTPVQFEVGGGRIVTQFEMKSVEAAGVLKMDFLGIRNLSILGTAVEIVEKTTGDKIDIYHLPLDDKPTFEMLARGETMGTFQLGGSGMTRWLKELKPSTIDDIMAMVALYRPGPMESIPEYIRRKYHPETVTYFDPKLETILSASFGLLVYQDDVMLTAIALAGYDWMEADKFRKAMGKKIPEEMAKQKEKFYKGCETHGKIKKEIIDEMWRAIEPFAAYGFNKAHAASYGIVAYQTSYMKAHYPVQYMTAVLQAESGDDEKVPAIVHECRRMGIDVLPPDINESFRTFAMIPLSVDASEVEKKPSIGRIRFGLSGIKNVGEHICEMIYHERKTNGPYASLEDLLTRVQDKDLNKKSLESLIQCGALDCFGQDRGVLLGNSEQLLFFARQAREKDITKQDSLFAGTSIAVGSKIILRSAPVATMEQKLHWEKQLLGLYISSHPFVNYARALEHVLTPTLELDGFARDSWIIVGGVIQGLKKMITKKGSVMMFATIEDLSGSVEVLVFPKTYEATTAVWVIGNMICVVGKTPKEDGDNKVFAENVHVLSPERVQELARQLSIGRPSHVVAAAERPPEKTVTLTIAKAAMPELTPKLKTFFDQHPGEYRVVLDVGGTLVYTNTFVACGSEEVKALEGIVGEGCVSVGGNV